MEIPVLNRYFAFGCSYTNYCWPTYADYLGTCFDEYYNLGASGAGNRYIFLKLMNLVNNQDILDRPLDSNDCITIQWSGLPREDKILPLQNRTDFVLSGHLGSQGTFPDEYVENYFSLIQSALELGGMITAAKNTLDKLGVHYKMFFMMEPEEHDFLGEVFITPSQTNKGIFSEDTIALLDNNMLNYISFQLPEEILSVEKHRLLYSYDKEKQYFLTLPTEVEGKFEIQKETHPTPFSHYEYAKYISEKIGIGTMENLNVDYSEDFEKFDKYYSMLGRRRASTVEKYDNNTFENLFPKTKSGRTRFDTPNLWQSTCMNELLHHIRKTYSSKRLKKTKTLY